MSNQDLDEGMWLVVSQAVAGLPQLGALPQDLEEANTSLPNQEDHCRRELSLQDKISSYMSSRFQL